MGTLGVVFDTNVLVSALGFGGPPLDAVLTTLDEEVRLLASEESLAELERVMCYEHLPFTEADRVQYLAILRREADVVRPDQSVDIVRDPDDDKFFEVALTEDADYIVSGDDDLLEVGSYRSVDVVSPADFVACVEVCVTLVLSPSTVDSAATAPNVPTQPPFEGSRRQFRGRIVRTLRKHGPLELDELGPRIRVDYVPDGEHGREWLRGLLDDLEADGLVTTDDGVAALRR